MASQSFKTKSIFFVYWILLLYVLAALVWWFIALSRQNEQLTQMKIDDLNKKAANYSSHQQEILKQKANKNAQYLGEGSIFCLLIIAGAVFLFRAVNKQLKESRRQEGFFMAITHELKTPIAVAQLNLETLQKHQLDEDKKKQLIDNTLQETQRMNSLCNNLLLTSQLESGRQMLTPENICMNDLLRSCIQAAMARYPKNNFVLLEKAVCDIRADVFLMTMAVNNLIENAVKYADKNAAVSMALEVKQGRVIMSVADEGPGIADADKKQVFKKHYRIGNEATKKSKGTGLGLYLVQRIIKAHNGYIEIQDRQPKGSVFVISLPYNSNA